MSYLLLSICWLVLAFFFGTVISFSDRIKKLPQIGLLSIFVSFVLGISMLLYAIAETL